MSALVARSLLPCLGYPADSRAHVCRAASQSKRNLAVCFSSPRRAAADCFQANCAINLETHTGADTSTRADRAVAALCELGFPRSRTRLSTRSRLRCASTCTNDDTSSTTHSSASRTPGLLDPARAWMRLHPQSRRPNQIADTGRREIALPMWIWTDSRTVERLLARKLSSVLEETGASCATGSSYSSYQ